jgi:hypothetical protein
VTLPALAFVALGDDPAAALLRVPASAGVGQIIGPEGRSLLLARAANLRRWAGSHLGLGKPPAPGRRPKTNLRGLATAVGFAATWAPFQQRLLYERLAAPIIPPSARRDLKPPAFLHLDPDERFPRVAVRGADEAAAGRFGPFRDRRVAEKARAALHKLFRLRPCDYVFEPDPALSLGLACVYAQVRSCVAPCLCRVSEDEYRALAAGAAGWLADPAARGDAPPAIPSAVAAAEAQALLLDPGRTDVGLYPVRDGRVLDAAAVTAAREGLEDAVARLTWPEAVGPSDWPWLTAWISSPKGQGSYLIVRDPADRGAILQTVLAALAQRFDAPAGGGNVGASRGQA